MTVVATGRTGYMRNYLLEARISAEDAQKLIDAMGASATPTPSPVPEETPTPAPVESFPEWAITLEQSNNTAIVLRGEPAGELPTSGAIPMINEPTPLELSASATDANGQLWYLATDLCTGNTGYLEAFKVRIVSRDEAMAAVRTPEPTIVPPEPEETPAPTDTPEPTPTPTPEPEEPQPLLEGDVYHYGYNTGKQVALRKTPDTNGTLITRLTSGTVLWVMQRTEGDAANAWCYVRTDAGEGYMKAEFVQLMGEN